MYCKGLVVFKGIDKREGGTFVSNGNAVDYASAYVVKFDELKEGKIDERKLKFPIDNKMLYEKFAKYDPYTKVYITFEIIFGNSACRLVPVEVEDYSDEQDIKE